MGAPQASHNKQDGKRWRQAIGRALSRATGNIDQGLDKLADKIVRMALAGDRWAMDHIADRLDGKPSHSLHITEDTNVRVTYAARLITQQESLPSEDPPGYVQGGEVRPTEGSVVRRIAG